MTPATRDRVVLSGIQFRGHHGDSEAERALGGRFEVDVEMTFDLRRAERTDTLKDTVDYYAVHQKVLEIGQGERHQLLERLAGRIASAVLAGFGPDEVTVAVRKLLPPLDGIVAYSGVVIARNRGDYPERSHG